EEDDAVLEQLGVGILALEAVGGALLVLRQHIARGGKRRGGAGVERWGLGVGHRDGGAGIEGHGGSLVEAGRCLARSEPVPDGEGQLAVPPPPVTSPARLTICSMKRYSRTSGAGNHLSRAEAAAIC